MSTERQRDAETDRLLRATLQPGVHAEACPGADMLAAYAEGSVSPGERDNLDVHFAECHSCQEALALMARAWPEPDTAQPSTAKRWWSLPRRWFVPVAAAAMVVMYVAVRPVIAPYFPTSGPPSEAGQSPVPQQLMADARSQERGSITVDPGASEVGQSTLPMAPGAKGAVPARDAGAPMSKVGETEQPTRPEALDDKRVGRLVDTSAGSRVSGTRGAEQSAPPKALEAKGAVRAGEAAVGTPVAVESPKLRAAAVDQTRQGLPPPEALVVAPAAARADVSEPRQQLAMKTAAAAPRDVVSPDGSVLWRISPGGRLFRSTDLGTTWQAQASGVSAELLAGSAPSASVCWIVGREATIIVTTDGAQWTTRSFPERVDLVAVEAADARRATVITREGRRFATLDGGATWSPKKE